MKNLHFEYSVEVRYSTEVTRYHYSIKCIPKDSERQKIVRFRYELLPESHTEWAQDSQGNSFIFGCTREAHSYFKYRISGDAECGFTDYEEVADENRMMVYRHFGKKTVPGACIKALYEKVCAEQPGFERMSPLEKAEVLTGAIHGCFRYEKGCTGAETSAEEALALGCGVCQDYTHILISLLCMAGCSARYVNGMLIGEGESHAWVEVADEEKWYGIDPTNRVRVAGDHIRIGVGRDASECSLVRGIIIGGGTQEQHISVSVSEISAGQQLLMKGAMLG